MKIFQLSQFVNSSPHLILIIDEILPVPPTLLAWSSGYNNKISVIDLDTKQSYASFDGVQIIEGISDI